MKSQGSRGVEHPVPSDGALIGDTRHELHHKSLPKHSFQNNYGKKELSAPGDDFRVVGNGMPGGDK